jgi:hypothetical protein
VALGDEVGCPSGPSVGSIEEVGAGLGCAGDEDDGERWVLRGWVWGELLDVDLSYDGRWRSIEGSIVLFPSQS